ncbi:DUF5677 domain-containing protein [Priestia megaterium]|uniref:DUF5677 domain-containing protein n=1 Tax=Priestia megaterium TaxID=1404 RepID=UPI001866C895|nr:DUF5677 domain-containing protein [Priestia megaterium]MBE2977779.1 hypothetical protein [Priestia megaterium]
MTKADDYLLTFTNEIVKDIYKELTEEKDEPEIQKVMPLLLFKTMLDKIHAIKVLADTNESRVGESTYSIARTICECKWYLLYMIQTDSNFRARSYYYFSRLDEAKSQVAKLKYLASVTGDHLANREQDLKNVQKNIDMYNKAIAEKDMDTLGKLHYENGLSPQDILAGKALADIFMDKVNTLNGYIADLNAQIVDIDKRKQEFEQRITHLESNPDFADIRTEIANIPNRLSRLKQYPTWYSLKTHIPSVRQLTIHLGLLNEYEGSYGTYSQDIHILNATKQIRLKEDKAVLKDEDKSSNNAESLEAYSFSISELSSVVREFLTHYGKEEEKENLNNNMAKAYAKN